MVQRRRYATREEVVQMLVERGCDRESIESHFDMLAELGVDAAALVKIVVDEPLEP